MAATPQPTANAAYIGRLQSDGIPGRAFLGRRREGRNNSTNLARFS
jgi:hypothetical protein